MSHSKRNSIGGESTSGGSRVRQAFKSPFRGNTSSDSTPKREFSSTVSARKTIKCGVQIYNLASEGEQSTQVTPKRLKQSIRVRQSSHKGFSAPFRSPRVQTLPDQAQGSFQDQLAELYKQEAEIDKEIVSLQGLGCKIEELQVHIENLHQYNEIKDAAQLVMGRLAELEGVTVKAMHEKYGISSTE